MQDLDEIAPKLTTALGYAIDGASRRNQAKSVASQLDRNSKLTQAAASRQAEDIRRQKRLILSENQARAASSGAGPAIDVQADIEREGERRALIALYTGNAQAQGLRDQARAYRLGGRRVRDQRRFQAVRTILG